MAKPGRIRRRLALAIVLTALIPLLAALWYSQFTVRTWAERFYRPEVAERLDASLELYKELVAITKGSLRWEAAALAASPDLERAARERSAPLADQALGAALAAHPDLASLALVDDEGVTLAERARAAPLNEQSEHAFTVEQPVPTAPSMLLTATFAVQKSRFTGREEMSAFIDQFHTVEARTQADKRGFMAAWIALLGITIVAGVGVGVLMARSVSSRIGELAEATRRVAAGDLAVRVPERDADEITDLARAFNRMLSEVETSRARIEYLQRMGAWQDMARRLAHEIKNPLTPIQLAVQEIHRRYDDHDPAFRRLLDMTLEVVEDEVGTLRRLVSEFSGFARLPRASLVESDLAAFLRDQEQRLRLREEERAPDDELAPVFGVASVTFHVPEGPCPAGVDRQMLGRAFVNLVRNAAQAIRGATDATREGRIDVTLARAGDTWVLDVEDSGPGIPPAMRARVFEPYVTTKADGTGLGLAIVKKIIVEHGGDITVEESRSGGARIRIRLPVAGTPTARAALEAERDAAEGGAPATAASAAP